MTTIGHVTASVCLCILLTLNGSQANAQTGSSVDTIFTTRGAATLINCGASVSTFQIGDGKNADYDYRIVDGNLVFIRPTAANPRTTNLIVREGGNIHYLILAYRDRVDLTQLKYTLSGKAGAEKGAAPDAPEAAVVKGSDGEQITVVEDDVAAAAHPGIDTFTVGKIAEDFGKQGRASRQYETKTGSISLSFSNAMTLNNLAYFAYRIKNRSQQPYNLVKATMMYKDSRAADRLYTMPVLYKKAPAAIGKDEQELVFVVPSRVFKRNDQVIVVLQNNADQKQLVLYTPVNALPKYMISQ